MDDQNNASPLVPVPENVSPASPPPQPYSQPTVTNPDEAQPAPVYAAPAIPSPASHQSVQPTYVAPMQSPGAPQAYPAPIYQNPMGAASAGQQPIGTEIEGSKSFVVAWILSALLGSLGIDRFYLGKIGTGILKLITVGGIGIWSWIDFLRLGLGTPRDKSGSLLNGFYKNRHTIRLITIIYGALLVITIPPIIIFFALVAVPALQKNAAKINAEQAQQAQSSQQLYSPPVPQSGLH